MRIFELTCISCPLGCSLKVRRNGNKVLEVTGNTCKKGKIYAEQEILHPMRTVTSTVPVLNGVIPVVSVKTESCIPREMIGACMQALKQVTVTAPVFAGDEILADAAGTGIRIIATKDVKTCGEKTE